MASGEVRSGGRGKVPAIINIQGFKCLKESGVGTKLGTWRKSRRGARPTYSLWTKGWRIVSSFCSSLPQT